MKKYIGIKLIEAEPMSKERCDAIKSNSDCVKEVTEGYKVVYADGYTSWSPKEVFEKAYMNIGDNNTIEEHNVNDFIKGYDISQWGDKTTVVHATLANGFIITESSSCVDPVNFNMDIGTNICKEKIQDKVWGFLGFMLQSAIKGFK